MSNSQFLPVNNGTRLDPPHASGLMLGLAGGYELVPGLAFVGDFQYARAGSIEGRTANGSLVQTSYTYKSLTLGVRATRAAGPGEVYLDFGLGLAFPFDTQADNTGGGGGGGGGGGTAHTTTGYNTGIGGRGELGYHYAINDRMYVGGGLRLEAFSTDNVGRTRVRTDQAGQTETETFTTDPNAQGPSASALSVQDVRVRFTFGYRL